MLATIVLIGHLNVFAKLPWIFSQIMSLGAKAAVVGFLLISGFSVGNSYNKSKGGYYLRRFLRIYPLYIVSVLFAVFLQYFLGSPFQLPGQTMVTAGWLTSICNVFFLQEFAGITITYNGPLWSLAIEVFFYLILPLLTTFSTRAVQVSLLISMAAFAFLFKEVLYGYMALLYAWPWLLGLLISKNQSLKQTFLFVVLGVVGILINKIVMPERLSWLTFSVVSVIVIASIYFDSKLPGSIIKIFNYLGDLSYPLYLFHFPIYLLLYYLGVRNAYLFCFIMMLSIIPINLIFDRWLKNIFWKPALTYLSEKYDQVVFKRRLSYNK